MIMGGTVLRGKIKLDQQMMFGPDRNGNFRQVIIKSIHENRVSISEGSEGMSICANVKPIGQNKEPIKAQQVRKGSCLIDPITTKVKGVNAYHSLCVRYFDASLRVNFNQTHITIGYEAILHQGGLRQTVQVVDILLEDETKDKILR